MQDIDNFQTPPELTILGEIHYEFLELVGIHNFQQEFINNFLNVFNKKVTTVFPQQKKFQVEGKITMRDSPKVQNSAIKVGALQFHILLMSFTWINNYDLIKMLVLNGYLLSKVFSRFVDNKLAVLVIWQDVGISRDTISLDQFMI